MIKSLFKENVMTMETQGSRVKGYECRRHNLKVVVDKTSSRGYYVATNLYMVKANITHENNSSRTLSCISKNRHHVE